MSAASFGPSTPLDRVLTRLARRTGVEPIPSSEKIGRWRTDCPIRHAEANTLGIWAGGDGRVVLMCRRGCSAQAIAIAVDLDMADLFPVAAMSDDEVAHQDAVVEAIGAPAPVKTRWRLDELLADESIMTPPPVIVPRLAWAARSTLLSAREKAGKSTLTGYVAAAVSNGGEFLGEPCERGVVLIIGLEEFIGDAARRLRDFGADPERVHLVDRLLGEPALRPQELRAHVDAVKPVLVIVDSLTAYGLGHVRDENDAAQMSAVLQPLSDMAHQIGVALLIIHHSAKSGRARGSTAIMAGVDVVVEFEAPEELEGVDDTLRRVRSVGRVPVARQYDIRYTGEPPAAYALVEQGALVALDARILAFVRGHPMCSQRKVTEAVKARSQEVAAMVLEMLRDGRLTNRGNTSTWKLVVPDAVQTRFAAGAG